MLVTCSWANEINPLLSLKKLNPSKLESFGAPASYSNPIYDDKIFHNKISTAIELKSNFKRSEKSQRFSHRSFVACLCTHLNMKFLFAFAL